MRWRAKRFQVSESPCPSAVPTTRAPFRLLARALACHRIGRSPFSSVPRPTPSGASRRLTPALTAPYFGATAPQPISDSRRFSLLRRRDPRSCYCAYELLGADGLRPDKEDNDGKQGLVA